MLRQDVPPLFEGETYEQDLRKQFVKRKSVGGHESHRDCNCRSPRQRNREDPRRTSDGDGLMHAGIPRGAILPIAVLELSSLALYLFPRSAVLGALLLTGYFGGATVTHIIGRENFIPPLIVGLWIWGGVYFRVAELRDLLPLRKSPAKPAYAPLMVERAVNADYTRKEKMKGFQRLARWINRL